MNKNMLQEPTEVPDYNMNRMINYNICPTILKVQI